MEYAIAMSEHSGTWQLRLDTFFALMYAEIRVWSDVEQALRQADVNLTLGRFIPLSYLAEKPMRLQDLSACCHTKESALSRLVDRMQQSGLLTKDHDPGDKRAVVLKITEEGLRVEQEARKVVRECLGEVFGSFTQGQLHDMVSLFSEIIQHGQGVDGQ